MSFLEKFGSKYKDITAEVVARHKQMAIGKKDTGSKDTIGHIISI